MLQARNALQLFLRSIPVGSLFNSMVIYYSFYILNTVVVIGFGSTFRRLFPSSVVYDDSSFKLASQDAAIMEVLYLKAA